MLKKELCQICWNKVGWSGWMTVDETNWKKGYIDCPYMYREEAYRLREITGKPPTKCPFILEHILSNEDII